MTVTSATPVKRVLLKDYIPSGEATYDDFILDSTSKSIDLSNPDAALTKPGQVLLAVMYLSVDPYMRSRMKGGKGYFVDSFVPGEPVESEGVAKVLASTAAGFTAGDFVTAMVPWETLVVREAAGVKKVVHMPPPAAPSLSHLLGTLGMPGITAWASIQRIGKPKAGEAAFVSGAAGAVGTVAGQLLKHVYGCRVVGSAGTDEKVDFLVNTLGFDAAFNYKKVSSQKEALQEHCPDGIDIYFDNVGGETLEAVLEVANNHARVIACGAISQYDAPKESKFGVRTLDQIVFKRITFQGFIIFDFYDEAWPGFWDGVIAAIQEGKVKAYEQRVVGIENAGKAFVDMMKGVNTGKMVVSVAPHLDPSYQE